MVNQIPRQVSLSRMRLLHVTRMRRQINRPHAQRDRLSVDALFQRHAFCQRVVHPALHESALPGAMPSTLPRPVVHVLHPVRHVRRLLLSERGRRNLELFASGRDTAWRNRLVWGDKKYVLPSLLPELAGKVNLIYIDPPFDTGTDFSFTASIPEHPDAAEDETIYFTKEPSIIEQKA